MFMLVTKIYYINFTRIGVGPVFRKWFYNICNIVNLNDLYLSRERKFAENRKFKVF